MSSSALATCTRQDFDAACAAPAAARRRAKGTALTLAAARCSFLQCEGPCRCCSAQPRRADCPVPPAPGCRLNAGHGAAPHERPAHLLRMDLIVISQSLPPPRNRPRPTPRVQGTPQTHGPARALAAADTPRLWVAAPLFPRGVPRYLAAAIFRLPLQQLQQ